MERKLTQAQLEQIIAEVQRLSEQQEAELDLEQVRDILRQLNLPPELLEEAMVQLHRRDVLGRQKRQNRWPIGIVIGILLLIFLGITRIAINKQQILARVMAQSDRITLAEDDGSNLTTLFRETNGEVFYRVTLSDAPVGKKLSLSCNWIAPNNQIVHQNRYQTKEITTPIWHTYCHYRIGSATPTGRWQVQMFLGNRLLKDANFEVK